MTPEELQAALDAEKAEKEKLSKELEELRKKNNPPAPPEDKKTLEEQEEENRKQREKIDAESKKIENAVEFNLKIGTFVKDNLEIVGEKIKGIIELASQRTYPNGIEKANELRASILNAFFSEQANIDALPMDSFKNKALEFLKLTQIKRTEDSAKYWELFELAVENIKKEKKHAELLKGKDGKDTDVKGAEYEKKFFDMRAHYIKENK
ncbi:MAG: hypothetical protein LBU09_00125 [Endomicrobium sp.]|jgi:hypothetical protein|nr:hypothetical protein [Endomicrobium sp.]